MNEVEGITRTAKEALHCKNSAAGGDTASPLLNHVYASRALIVHKAVEASINVLRGVNVSSTKLCSSLNTVQLILLGAGLDTTYDALGSPGAAVTSNNFSCTNATVPVLVYAVDFPSVLQKRMNMSGALSSTRYVQADMRDAPSLWSKLEEAGVRYDMPLVVVTEMVCNYMNLASVQALASVLEAKRQQSRRVDGADCLWISYDFYALHEDVVAQYDTVTNKTSANDALSVLDMPRPIGFAGDMLKHYSARGAPLLQVQVRNSLQCMRLGGYNGSANQVAAHFSTLWPCAYIQPMEAWISCRSPNTAHRQQGNLPMGRDGNFFDEYVSLALLHRHFGLAIYGSAKSTFCACLLEMGITQRKQSIESIWHQEIVSRWEQVSHLYRSAFVNYTHHRTVAKFVAMSLKQLQPSNPFCISFVCLAQAPLTSERNENSLTCDVLALPLPVGMTGTILGFVSLRLLSSSTAGMDARADTLELSHLCVDSEHRGTGMGRRLMEAALQYAKQGSPSPKNIVLTVMTELHAAIRLYTKVGFRTDGLPVENGTCFLQKMVYCCT